MSITSLSFSMTTFQLAWGNTPATPRSGAGAATTGPVNDAAPQAPAAVASVPTAAAASATPAASTTGAAGPRRSPLVDAMMQALRELGVGTAGAAAPATNPPATTTSGTPTPGSVTPDTDTPAPAPSGAEIESAVRGFVHELFHALRDLGGSGDGHRGDRRGEHDDDGERIERHHGHREGHHGHRFGRGEGWGGGMRSLADRLGQLEQALGAAGNAPATPAATPATSAAGNAPVTQPAPVASTAAASPVATAVTAANTNAATAPAATESNAATGVSPAVSAGRSLVQAFQQLLQALRPAEPAPSPGPAAGSGPSTTPTAATTGDDSSAATPATDDPMALLRRFLHTLSEGLSGGAVPTLHHCGSMLNTCA